MENLSNKLDKVISLLEANQTSIWQKMFNLIGLPTIAAVLVSTGIYINKINNLESSIATKEFVSGEIKSINTRFDGVDNKLDSMDKKLDKVIEELPKK